MKHSLNFAAFVLTAFFFSPFPLRADNPAPARPGTINYVEGQVLAGSQTLDSKSIGNVELSPGETISTTSGKAEVLLTPGVFVRLGDQTSARMISTSLTNTQMSLDQGEATVEVVEIHPENLLGIVQDGHQTQLVKTGLYDFNENLHVVRVLDGQAIVQDARKGITVKAGHMVDLSTTEPLKATKFDKKQIEAEDLYRWTSLRSAYLAEANADAAPVYSFGGFGWYGDGWYWDPWFDAYTFLPGDGIFYSPFGWGFYSPWCAFAAPVFWGGHFYHHFSTNYQASNPQSHYGLPANYGRGVRYAHRSGGGVLAGRSRGGFSRGGGFHGGGFHSGGGFHGGGGGGHH